MPVAEVTVTVATPDAFVVPVDNRFAADTEARYARTSAPEPTGLAN